MLDFVENFIFLRPLNYLRVSHNDARLYNVTLPAFFTALFALPLLFVGEANFYGSKGLLEGVSGLLALIAPFYIAALAAVATFNGQANLDDQMKGVNPPSLTMRVKGKMTEPKILTLRHFLSLMFGYCSLLSLILFILNVAVRFYSDFDGMREVPHADILGVLFLLAYGFFFMQLFVITVLGLYFLSDKIHRPN